MTELIWDGKYDKNGKRVAPVKVSLPFQTIETVNESAQDRQRTLSLFAMGKPTEWRNRLIWGDKKYVLPSLLPEFAGKVNLIYIDPPFFTGTDQTLTIEVPSAEQFLVKEPSLIEEAAYRNIWRQGSDSFCDWLYETLYVLSELLAADGAIFVRFDQYWSHYVKIIADEVFGKHNFQNEIVLKRTFKNLTNQGRKSLQIATDSLFLYFKSSTSRFYDVEVGLGEERPGYWRALDDSSGVRNPPERTIFGKVYYPPPGKHFKFGQQRIDSLCDDGKVRINDNGRPQYYVDPSEKKPLTSNWTDIPGYSFTTGYPTENSETVLERVIRLCSQPEDLVLDCFCLRRGSRAYARRDGQTPLLSPRVRGEDQNRNGSLPVHGEGRGGASPATLTPIEDIRTGDEVFGHDGAWHRVSKTHRRRYRGAMYGIRFADLTETLWTTADHRLLVQKRPIRFPRPEASPNRWAHVLPELFPRSRELRNAATPVERQLWQYLRKEQLGVAFRRQHPIGPFIADFYCKEARLVIELDGGGHADPEAIASDIRRTEWLESIGLAVLRFWNTDVLKNPDGVVQAIQEHVAYACPVPGMDAEWRQAKDLAVGDKVYCGASLGAPLLSPRVRGEGSDAPSPYTGRAGVGFSPDTYSLTEIESIVTEDADEEVFDLTVEESHSYLTSQCFVHNCGSGTTAAVAEKLGRRWIACDLGRFAIHTTRKRLLGVEGVKPFVVQNLGKYERQAWQSAEFGDAESRALRETAYRHFILNLYHAEPVTGFNWFHGVKAGRLVHVGAVDAPVSVGDVKAMIQEFWRSVGNTGTVETNKIDALGWDFAFDLNETARQQAQENRVDLRWIRIPREAMDKKAVDAGDVTFYELGALDVKTQVKGLDAVLTLNDFIIPPDDVPEDVQKAIRHWSQWIDYWAVDWNYRDDTFHNEWQTYRTKKSPKIELSARHRYDELGEYTVVVKVIDIFGNDTTKSLTLETR